MKQWIFVLAVLLSGTGAAAQGILEVENKVLELASLKADDQPRTEVFAVKNTGDRPVIITRVSPMSYLLEAEWQREPLLPGRSGSIRVTFVPARLPERFDYKIMVYSNAAEKRTELRLKGNLVDNPEKPALLYHYTIDGMKFKKSNVNFGKVYTWETVKDTVRYLNTRQDAVTVGIAKDLPAHLSAEFVPARVEPGEGGMLVLTYDAKAKGDYGYCYESLPLEVNGKRDPRNRLTITATLAEDFSRLDHIFSTALHLKDARGYFFDAVLGLTPESSLSWRLALRCGARLVGRIPNGVYLAAEDRSAPAVLVAATRESLKGEH